LADENMRKLPGSLQLYENKISDIKEKIVFAYQEETIGFGHAVLQSSSFADDGPVLLLLGDHLYSTKSNRSCLSQMIDAYEKTKKLTLGLFEVPLDEVAEYGIVKGEYVDKNNRMVKLDAIVEKPSLEYAEKNLGVDGKQLAVFLYVLTPEVYKTLNHMIRSGKVEFGEFQLTPSLNEVAQTIGAYGAVIDGERFDIGSPDKYRLAVTNYGR
jgi:UTP--glucose-1-phosphate uridylyltransferase